MAEAGYRTSHLTEALCKRRIGHCRTGSGGFVDWRIAGMADAGGVGYMVIAPKEHAQVVIQHLLIS